MASSSENVVTHRRPPPPFDQDDQQSQIPATQPDPIDDINGAAATTSTTIKKRPKTVKRSNRCKQIMPIVVMIVVSLLSMICFALFLPLDHNFGDAPPCFSFADIEHMDISSAPAVHHFAARDNSLLYYRIYTNEKYQPVTGKAPLIALLVHSMTGSGLWMHSIARMLARNESIAAAYAIDIRGHGANTSTRGDTAYIGQLQHDISDFFSNVLIPTHSDVGVLLVSHSSSSQLVISLAASDSPISSYVKGVVLLAPYLGPASQGMKEEALAAWAKVEIPRLMAIFVLNVFQIKSFNHLAVLTFNVPNNLTIGSDQITTVYSYRMLLEFGSSDVDRDLANCQPPVLLVAPALDEAFNHTDVVTTMSSKTRSLQSIQVNATHFGVLTHPDTARGMLTFVQQIIN